MAEDQQQRSRQLDGLKPLEKEVEKPLVDAGETKYREGQQGVDPQVERLTRDYQRLKRQLQLHDRILKDYEIGDVSVPIKRMVMQDETGNPVVLKANSDGTVSIIPFEEDVNYG